MTLRVGVTALAVAALFAGLARADEPGALIGAVDVDRAVLLADQPVVAEPFAKGSWALDLTGLYVNSSSLQDDRIDGGIAEVGAGYYFLDRLAIYGSLAGSYLDQEGEDDAWGGGFNLLLRWHFLRLDPVTIFVDGGAGLIQFSDDFPAGGTHFNFTERVGLGASWQLKDNLHLIGGARYMHISNARIDGSDRNPGMDGMQYYLGLVFTF